MGQAARAPKAFRACDARWNLELWAVCKSFGQVSAGRIDGYTRGRHCNQNESRPRVLAARLQSCYAHRVLTCAWLPTLFQPMRRSRGSNLCACEPRSIGRRRMWLKRVLVACALVMGLTLTTTLQTTSGGLRATLSAMLWRLIFSSISIRRYGSSIWRGLRGDAFCNVCSMLGMTSLALSCLWCVLGATHARPCC